MSGIRILPLPKVTGIWNHDCSKYPDVVRVPMSDGRVVRYVLDVEQPAPVLRDKLDRFREKCIGYEMKKPEDAGTSNRPDTNETTESIPRRRRRRNESTV